MKTHICKALVLSYLVIPLLSSAQYASLITTFTNPTPTTDDRFGYPVVGLGGDRVAMGAYFDDSRTQNAGAAYLFSTNGTLLTTFFSPVAKAWDAFGASIAAVGREGLLIGAPFEDRGALDTGAAYLFSTSGVLLTTFTNPTPAQGDVFGSSIAAFGNDRVIIGAYEDDIGAVNAGASYLFSTNGTLLITITNPAPILEDHFAIALAALGTDRIAIGAPNVDTGAINAGVVYLFSTNGDLLTTITNPAPVDSAYFGSSVGALGGDRVLVGAPNNFPGRQLPGAAYLFTADGALLATLTNRYSNGGDSFGCAVASVNDQVVVGAGQDSTGATNAWAAYLFSTNGILLASFLSPSPAPSAAFGNSVAAVGTGHVVVGGFYADLGATSAGAAYLFSTQVALAPSLVAELTGTNMLIVSWPSPSTGFTLQENTNGISTTNWTDVTEPVHDTGTAKYIMASPLTGNRFYRLRSP